MLTHSLLVLLGLAALPAIAHRFFNIPPGSAGKVSIIDSASRVNGAATSVFLKPKLEGFDVLASTPSWSFLVQSSTGRKVLFDLSWPRDPYNSFAPSVVKQLQNFNWDIEAEKHVADVLVEGGFNLTQIESIIWSHFHFDHIGDPSTFPTTTELVVGPGFKDALLPAYPTNPDSPLQERYFVNRTLREVDFTNSPPLKAGAFRAFDFFGDGSFFLLDTPGHAIGHLGGLARTSTKPDTFIFMGGDLCHHGGQMRPSPDLRIPSHVHLHGDGGGYLGKAFEQLNIDRGRKRDRPFFDPVLVDDAQVAMQTIKNAQKADADTDVLFVFAHDADIEEVVDFFPKTANQWKKKGWGERVRWEFLGDLVPALKGKGGKN